jgi:hypothetical protein
MAFSINIASDITAIQLEGYLRPKNPKDILQHVQNKPLLRALQESKVEFGSAGSASGGTAPANVREGVMGALMQSQSGFYAGISDDDVLVFKSSDGAVQTTCPVRWMHAGFQITHDELLYAGVHVTKDNKTTSTADDRTALLNLLETKKADYMESVMFARNKTLWLDGSQDSKAIAGIKSIITDDPTTGTTLGVARSNTWWRHIARTGVGGALAKLVYSKADQTLTEGTLTDFRQLTRFGGNPDTWFAGSDYCDAFEREARAKGQLTQTGWADRKTNVAVKGIKVGNIEIEYDPTLDDLGESKRCYAWDSRHLRLRPQKQEWGKVTNQNQPSDQFVMLISTTDRGVLTCNQMDACYVAEFV